MSKKPIEKTFSKIVGTTFDGRQQKIVRAKAAGVQLLRMVREPENPYDKDAIGVYADIIGTAGARESLHLGYISNSTYECLACGFLMDGRGRGAPKSCTECDGDEFERRGLASEFARAMDKGIEYKCTATEFTGGGDGENGEEKNYGVNIFIEMLKATEPIADGDEGYFPPGMDNYGSLSNE